MSSSASSTPWPRISSRCAAKRLVRKIAQFVRDVSERLRVGLGGAELYLMANEDAHAAGWRDRKPNPATPLPWPHVPWNLTHFSLDWYHDPSRACGVDADCVVPGVGAIGWCIAAERRCSNVRDYCKLTSKPHHNLISRNASHRPRVFADKQLYTVSAAHHRFLIYPPAYGSKTNGLIDVRTQAVDTTP